MGITFKENVPDIRNSKVVDIIHELREFGVNVHVIDPVAQPDDVRHEYGLELSDMAKLGDLHAVIIAVSHQEYMKMDLVEMKKLFNNNHPVLIDVKNIVDPKQAEKAGFNYWSL
jgi:UDP-N-acetyl-D-glucosamine/UDP-N-acetyl-D-galactosamine dehydrogenase